MVNRYFPEFPKQESFAGLTGKKAPFCRGRRGKTFH
jgi:hypothetical protein